jgi:hypothetical protein
MLHSTEHCLAGEIRSLCLTLIVLLLTAAVSSTLVILVEKLCIYIYNADSC